MTRLFFKDELFDAQLLRAVSAGAYGGAQLGECLAAAKRVKEGDLDSWYDEWTVTAEAAYRLGEEAEAAGRRRTARDAFLRACTYYRTAGGMLLGAPLDPRLVESNKRQTEAFRRGAALLELPPEILEIPCEDATLPGYFFRAADDGQARATIILTDGYDGSVEELYFLTAAEAVARGYNVLAFDGPGQGAALVQRGMVLRPDWENVVTPVVDYALTRSDVDPDRIALIGFSLGAYLAPRAASGEHRLAACVADCGTYDIFDMFAGRMPSVLAKKLNRGNRFSERIASRVCRLILKKLMKKPTAGWALRRNQLVHGIDDPVELMLEMRNYTLKGRAENIACPTFVCNAEGDAISASAPQLVAALTCEKAFYTFTAAEGAGDHCEVAARPLYFAKSFDWLDAILNPDGSSQDVSFNERLSWQHSPNLQRPN